MDTTNVLISTAISSGLYILYKTINHYRLKSECNKDNQLVITITDTQKVEMTEEKKEGEIKGEP